MATERVTVALPEGPHAHAAAYDRGEIGGSVRELKLSGLTFGAVHDLLVSRGFRAFRTAIPAERTRLGLAQWKTLRATTTVREDAACEYVYAHADRGLVRLFPPRGPTRGFEPLGEIAGPFARKSLVADVERSTFGWDDEVAVITEAGQVLPKALRVADGMKFAAGTALRHSYRLARAAFAEQRIPLKKPSSPELAPRVPLVDTEGLGCGLTIAPKADFAVLLRRILARVARDPAVVVERWGPDRVLFFAGDRDVAARTLNGCAGLSSLAIHEGAHVLSVDPVGFEASVAALGELVGWLLSELRGFAAYDHATGTDVSRSLERRPFAVVASTRPTAVTFDVA